MRRGALVGFVLLLVVVALVLYLSAENWKSVAPQVKEVMAAEGSPETLLEEGSSQEGAGGAGHLPGLGEMKAETDEHAKALEEALAASAE